MRKNPAMDVFLGFDRSESLMHSEEYLGSEYDEGLQHWKYIKKYKNSKGKTVYVYANKDTHSNIYDTGRKAEIKDNSAHYYKERQRSYHVTSSDKASTEQYYLNKKRREKAERQANQYRNMADIMMKRNELFGKTKKKIKNSGRAVSLIHKASVVRTTNFIGRTISKINKKVNSIKRESVVTGFKFISGILK